MSAILTLIYREYCRARLAEIAKVKPEVNETAED
jgi:DNA-binding TFAR19-related protein (PDSD5 family)